VFRGGSGGVSGGSGGCNGVCFGGENGGGEDVVKLNHPINLKGLAS